jgi:hypothetical protein
MGVVTVRFLGIHFFDWLGVVTAVSVLFLRRILGNFSLLYPGYLVLKSSWILGRGDIGPFVPIRVSEGKVSG